MEWIGTLNGRNPLSNPNTLCKSPPVSYLPYTIGILEKDVKSFLDAVNETSPNNKAMKKFQNSLIEGLKGIPSYPN